MSEPPISARSQAAAHAHLPRLNVLRPPLVALLAAMALIHVASCGRVVIDGGPQAPTETDGTDEATTTSTSLSTISESTMSLSPDPDSGCTKLSSYEVSTAPNKVVAADVNGDGKPDLAVTAGYGNGLGVRVLLNKGDGTFDAAVLYSLGKAYNQFVAAGDMNGDALPDLVVVSAPNPNDGGAGTSVIDVLLNKGGGVFGAPVSTSAAGTLGEPAVADVDGDGKPDVVTTDSSSLLVLLNKGGGVLGAPVKYALSAGGWGPVVKDLNGDGNPDVAVISGATVNVLLNKGGGVLAGAVSYAAGSMPSSLAIADLDGDGSPDLAVADQTSNAVQWLRNEGNGTFGAEVGVPVGQAPASVAAGDIDGDGKVDLAVTLWGDSTMRVFLNAGGGTWSPGSVTTVGPAPQGLVVSDLDGDGKLDAAFGVAMGTTVDVVLGLPCP